MEEKFIEEKEKNAIFSKLKEKKKIVGIGIFIIIISTILMIILITGTSNINLENYSIEAQKILYAIEYYDIKSLDSKALKELDNEILEKTNQNKNKEVGEILFNYHMGIGMMADNISTDNEMIIDNIKNYLQSAESKYKSLLSKKHKEYIVATKKEEYKKIDNYKLSDLLNLSVTYFPELNINAIYSLGTSVFTGYSRFEVNAINKIDKEIKYIDINIDICNDFQDKLINKQYKCIGPFSYNKLSTIKFDREYISDYKIAKYIKIKSVKITYTDNSIINLDSEKIDTEATEIKIN